MSLIRKPSWPQIVLLGAFIAGIVLLFTLHDSQMGALGEPLFVVGSLGLTVDAYLKKVLVEDIANLAIQAIYGVNAPQEYVEKLSNDLGRVDLIVTHCEYCLNLQYVNGDRNCIEVRLEMRLEYTNIGAKSALVGDPEVGASAAPGKESRFSEYEIVVRRGQPGRRAQNLVAQHFSLDTNARMAEAQRRKSGGIICLKRAYLEEFEAESIPPEGTAYVRIVSFSYQLAHGGISLSNKSPVLDTVLIISGPAESDLLITPYHGTTPLDGDRDSGRYEHKFRHADATLRVEWSLRENGQPLDGPSPQAEVRGDRDQEGPDADKGAP